MTATGMATSGPVGPVGPTGAIGATGPVGMTFASIGINLDDYAEGTPIRVWKDKYGDFRLRHGDDDLVFKDLDKFMESIQELVEEIVEEKM